ncbi:hypothetical protein [Sodalis-like endosymbiont of Proechinophthirus fluctus]|uniref:hypothetical protein n=1 Tax=Sodalis-like endosymbiont of Proechinophthirus fluctus TaxID=1462730 RepID=UPI000AA9C262|nr:hypothetical protein [Sodalis-like endosymbiont of Proechinophthirus fluctus]
MLRKLDPSLLPVLMILAIFAVLPMPWVIRTSLNGSVNAAMSVSVYGFSYYVKFLSRQ